MIATRLLDRLRSAGRDRPLAVTAAGGDALLEQELMLSLQRLALAAPRVQRGTFAGEHRSRRRGASPEFADFKSYSPGDDIRRVDWNLYARLDELFIRVSEITTDLTVHFLLDASASMDWRARDSTPTKYRFAQKIAAALAYVALWHFDRIRVSPLSAGRLPPFGPAQGRTHVPGLLAYLEDCLPGGDQTASERMTLLAARETTPGLLVVLSDLLNEDPDLLLTQCKALRSKGWDIAVVHIVDAAELTPAGMFVGLDRSQPTTLIDAESGQRVMILPSQASLDRYSGAVTAWLTGLEEQFRLHGITYLRLTTDQPIDTAVLRLLNERGVIA